MRLTGIDYFYALQYECDQKWRTRVVGLSTAPFLRSRTCVQFKDRILIFGSYDKTFKADEYSEEGRLLKSSQEPVLTTAQSAQLDCSVVYRGQVYAAAERYYRENRAIVRIHIFDGNKWKFYKHKSRKEEADSFIK